MKWIFFSLVLANLAYLFLSMSNEQGTVDHSSTNVEIQGETLQLLREARRDGRDRALQEAIRTPTIVDDPETSPVCAGLGPFENVIAAQEVVERLDSIGLAVELTAVDTPTGGSDYRVVMPPLSSLQEAFRRLREFKSRDIDSYVITQGEDAQGISLGVFSTDEAAESHRQDLAELGYEVAIRVIPRVSRGYWILGGEEELPEGLIAEAMARHPGVSVTETSCLN